MASRTRSLEEAMWVVSLERLAILIDNYDRTWSLGIVESVFSETHATAWESIDMTFWRGAVWTHSSGASLSGESAFFWWRTSPALSRPCSCLIV